MSAIQLIVGLGNPGREYEETRHNAGAWFVEQLARTHRGALQSESKFSGLTGRIQLAGQDLKLLIPTTFMNLSGQAIAALATFFKIPIDAILIAHDELDIPVGEARFKQGGGHGGHNGLRDTISKLGNQNNFHRLRIGIGHPGSADKVVGYVLDKPSGDERISIDRALDAAAAALPLAISGQWARAMTQLHAFKVEN
ncbi:MAG: peptidyl-tRNA hydrolase [Verrucomicrobiaceae bacterium]|nr:peptidyl-tRNA hydrolase [Verrucomicrobiaceae bacterium]